jgi:hypothetical protein
MHEIDSIGKKLGSILGDALEKRARIVVLGGSGAGKSTVMTAALQSREFPQSVFIDRNDEQRNRGGAPGATFYDLHRLLTNRVQINNERPSLVSIVEFPVGNPPHRALEKVILLFWRAGSGGIITAVTDDESQDAEHARAFFSQYYQGLAEAASIFVHCGHNYDETPARTYSLSEALDLPFRNFRI